MGIGKMNKFDEYTFVKGLEGLTSEKKHKKLTELERRLKVLNQNTKNEFRDCK